ncbi:MAG: molybdopterin synthase catalytic subunit [Verrucomicrobiales bacterium]
MGNPSIQTVLSTDPPPENAVLGSPAHGAEVHFRGIVRGTENARAIAGLNYSAYLPMAEKILREVAWAAAREHPEARVLIHHMIGFVAAGETSVLVAVALPHSTAAFELCHHLLRRVKTEVPIWKEAVLAAD